MTLFASRLAPTLALLALTAPFACGGSTASPSTDGDASTDAGTSTDDGAVVDSSVTCSRSTQLCSGRCVDTMNDPANCGSCGHSCGASSACVMSTCQATGNDPVFAFSKLFVGDTDRSGVSSQTAWKQYGADIDGKTTDRNSTDVCTLAAGASKSTQTDGTNGIDNSWGENILPIFLTAGGADFGKKINDAINAGAFTNMLKIDGLGTQSSYASLPSALFGGAPIGMAPAWNGSDVWPVDATSVMNGDVTKPMTLFPTASMTNRVWVSGTIAGGFKLPLAVGGVTLQLPLTHSTVSMRIDATNQSAVEGVVSGVIPTEDFVNVLRTVAGRLSTSLCQGSAFDSIAQQIRQASVIGVDGTNVVGTPCNAISIGIGFEAKRAQLGGVVTPTIAPDPCH